MSISTCEGCAAGYNTNERGEHVDLQGRPVCLCYTHEEDQEDEVEGGDDDVE